MCVSPARSAWAKNKVTDEFEVITEMSKSKKNKKLGRSQSTSRADQVSLEASGMPSVQTEGGELVEHGDANTEGRTDASVDGNADDVTQDASRGMQGNAAAMDVGTHEANHIDAAPPAEEEPLLEFVVRDRNDLLEKFIRPQRLMRQRAHEREDHEIEPPAVAPSASPDEAIEVPEPALAAGAPPAPTTLKDLAQRYLERLEQQGKSGGTLSSYKLELDVAMEHFGRQLPLADLHAASVQEYYECPRVTTTRSGRSKSPLSIAKTRRVMHQALVLGVAQGWVERRVIDGEARAASSGD